MIDRVRADAETLAVGSDHLAGRHEPAPSHPPADDETGRRETMAAQDRDGGREEVRVAIIEREDDRPRGKPTVIFYGRHGLVKRDDVEAVIGQILHLHPKHRGWGRKAEPDSVLRIRIDPDVVVI